MLVGVPFTVDMRKALLIVAAALGGFGCHHLHSRENVSGPLSECDLVEAPLSRDLARVPSVGDISPFVQCWYSEQLRAMAEPYLADAPLLDGETIVRFTWLRSFHPGVAVRVESRAGGTTLTATELDGKGGYAPGKPHRREQKTLATAQWQEVVLALERAQFWEQPTQELTDPSVVMLDGASWIFETRTRNRYHIVHRQSPERGSLRALGLLMLRLADMLPGEHLYE
jgi:hypothetical protein